MLKSIKSQLLMSIALFVTLIVLGGAITIYVFIHLGEVSRLFVDDEIPQIIDANKIASISSELTLIGPLLSYEEHAEELKLKYNNTLQQMDKIHTLTARFSQRGNYPDLLALNRQAQSIRFNIDLIFQIRLKMLKNIHLLSDNQQLQLDRIVKENLAQLRSDATELKKLSDRHVIFVIKNMEAKKVKLDGLISKGTWLLVSLLIASLVIAVCVAWFLVLRKIILRLKKLNEIMFSVPSNIRINKIPGLDDNDEIGKMARALKSFIHRNRDYVLTQTSLDQVSDCVLMFSTDQNNTIFYANKGAGILFGYDHKELMRMSIKQLLPTIVLNGSSKEDVLEVNEVFETEGSHCNGEIIPVDIRLQLITVEDEPPLFIAILRDITKHKDNKDILEAIARNEELSKILTMVINVVEKQKPGFLCSVLLVDYSGTKLLNVSAPSLPDFYNEATAEIEIADGVGSCGTAAFRGETVIVEDIMTHPYWQDFLNLAKKAGFRACWSQPILDENKRVLGTFAMYYHDVRKPSESDFKLIENVASLATIAIEQKNHELNLLKAKEVAEYANQAKSKFLSNMSHEIRTPLNAVIGFSDILSTMITDKEQNNYISSIKTAGKSLLTLINDILDLSKIEAGMLEIKYRPLNLRVILNDIKQIFELETSKKNIDFIVHIDENLPKQLMLDETRLRQILLNITGNAIKFTEKGYIILSAKKLNERQQNRLDLLIRVEDTGIGMLKDDLDKIFGSFIQLCSPNSTEYEGTGLGLSISKKLTEAMNGNISVKSSKGEGSTFEMVFKDVEGGLYNEHGLVVNDVVSVNEIEFNKSKVLVVDNVESNRNYLSALLKKVNLQVLVANNGEEALHLIDESKPELIIMDIRMPVMDGIETTLKIKENESSKDIPIIALTASAITDDRNVIFENGFDGYLTKPVKPDQLLAELSHFLDHTIKKESNVTNNHLLNNNVINGIEKSLELTLNLKEEIIPSCLHLKKVMVISRVSRLGERLIELGREYKVNPLTLYGEELLEDVKIFDIIRIEEKIKELPEIIEQLNPTGE